MEKEKPELTNTITDEDNTIKENINYVEKITDLLKEAEKVNEIPEALEIYNSAVEFIPKIQYDKTKEYLRSQIGLDISKKIQKYLKENEYVNEFKKDKEIELEKKIDEYEQSLEKDIPNFEKFDKKQKKLYKEKVKQRDNLDLKLFKIRNKEGKKKEEKEKTNKNTLSNYLNNNSNIIDYIADSDSFFENHFNDEENKKYAIINLGQDTKGIAKSTLLTEYILFEPHFFEIEKQKKGFVFKKSEVTKNLEDKSCDLWKKIDTTFNLKQFYSNENEEDKLIDFILACNYVKTMALSSEFLTGEPLRIFAHEFNENIAELLEKNKEWGFLLRPTLNKITHQQMSKLTQANLLFETCEELNEEFDKVASFFGLQPDNVKKVFKYILAERIEGLGQQALHLSINLEDKKYINESKILYEEKNRTLNYIPEFKDELEKIATSGFQQANQVQIMKKKKAQKTKKPKNRELNKENEQIKQANENIIDEKKKTRKFSSNKNYHKKRKDNPDKSNKKQNLTKKTTYKRKSFGRH